MHAAFVNDNRIKYGIKTKTTIKDKIEKFYHINKANNNKRLDKVVELMRKIVKNKFHLINIPNHFNWESTMSNKNDAFC